MTVTLCRLSMRCRALRVAQSQSSRWTRATVSHVSSPSWKRAGLKPSFQQGASHPRKKGLFPPVGSNWMRDTIRLIGSAFATAPTVSMTNPYHHTRLERLLDNPNLLRRCPEPTALNRCDDLNSIR